jgi:uncharacterized protein (DUF1800 family)
MQSRYCIDRLPFIVDIENSAEASESGHQALPSPSLAAGATAAVLLAACGGSGDGLGGSSSGNQATAAQASRFLAQAGFSASDEDIATTRSYGAEERLNQSFSAAQSQSNWDWLVSQGYDAETYHYSAAPADYAIWHRLITAPDQLRQRIALALSEFFVVSINGVPSGWPQFAMAAYWDLLCEHAFGNFRQLLEAVTLNPAMGFYLNTKGNQKEDPATGRAPDENYAREVMQLFTIGLVELNIDGSAKINGAGQPIETYDQDDISNLARAFTGWDLDTTVSPASTRYPYRLPMRLNASRHSTLEARFLGTTVPAGTDGTTALRIALDALFQHTNVGPFFGRQLIQRLVTSNPSPAYVARVAAAFNGNGAGVRGDMKAVIRAVLLDPEARADDAITRPNGGKLREPMLRFIQWARTFNAASAAATWKIADLSDPAARLSQSPLRSPSVFNYFRPGYTPPNTTLAAAGLVAPEFQITNEPTVAGYLNFMQSVIANGTADVTPNYTTEIALAADPVALVSRLNLLLAANQLSAATQARISTAVASITGGSATGLTNRVRAAIMLVMACPEYLVQK